jgi:hypothetical protein
VKKKSKVKAVGSGVGFKLPDELAAKVRARFGSLNRGVIVSTEIVSALYEKETERVMMALTAEDRDRVENRATMVAGWPVSAMLSPTAVAEALLAPSIMSLSSADALVVALHANALSQKNRVKV